MSLAVRNVVARGLGAVLCIAGTATTLAAQAKPLPLKYVGPPTVPAITAGDLMTRLYKYADDSMMGRQVGTEYNVKATAYIEQEVRRLGLIPAGTDGGYFQDIGVIHRTLDLGSTLSVGGITYKVGSDFGATNTAAVRFENAPVMVWAVYDTTVVPTMAELAGKVVVFRTTGGPTSAAAAQAFVSSSAYQTIIAATSGSAGVLARLAVIGDSLPTVALKMMTDPNGTSMMLPSGKAPTVISVDNRVFTELFGAPLNSIASLTVGKSLTADIRFTDFPRGGRNVVAILPGSDPKLKGEYVAIGAHNDHIGFQSGHPVWPESDSLKVYNAVGRPAGAEGGRDLQKNPITAAEWTKINADIADLRKIYPPRPDSIANGADDDGSGTVSVLEIAEAFAKGNVKPKRSILFVWHTGEESGMWGSGYYMDHPTVSRDSIVAQLNIDMVGRGEASDETGVAKDGTVLHGSSGYLQLVGSRRLSTELGNLVESVNTTRHHNLTFDYSEDADGHPQNIYCRSDHWSYAKWNIPVVFFTTGGHADYHQVTDEPQYIHYEHMARVDSLIFDVADAVANLNHAPVVDGKKMADPNGACRQ